MTCTEALDAMRRFPRTDLCLLAVPSWPRHLIRILWNGGEASKLAPQEAVAILYERRKLRNPISRFVILLFCSYRLHLIQI